MARGGFDEMDVEMTLTKGQYTKLYGGREVIVSEVKCSSCGELRVEKWEMYPSAATLRGPCLACGSAMIEVLVVAKKYEGGEHAADSDSG